MKNETDSDVEQGPESSVDGDVLVPLDVTTPLTTGDKRQLNNNKINKNIVRPTTLTFVEEKRYDFIDVEVEIDTKVGEIHENEDDLPPLLETVLWVLKIYLNRYDLISFFCAFTDVSFSKMILILC